MSVTIFILGSIVAIQALVIVAIGIVLARAATYDGNIIVTTKNGITNFSLEVGDPYSLSDKKEMHFKVITRPSSTIELDRD